MEASTTSLTEHIASTTSLTSEPPSRAPILAKEIPVDISDGAVDLWKRELSPAIVAELLESPGPLSTHVWWCDREKLPVRRRD